MTTETNQRQTGETPEPPATTPYDPSNPDQQPDPEPLPIPPSEPQPSPIREPDEPLPAIDPVPTEPPRIA